MDGMKNIAIHPKKKLQTFREAVKIVGQNIGMEIEVVKCGILITNSSYWEEGKELDYQPEKKNINNQLKDRWEIHRYIGSTKS